LLWSGRDEQKSSDDLPMIKKKKTSGYIGEVIMLAPIGGNEKP